RDGGDADDRQAAVAAARSVPRQRSLLPDTPAAPCPTRWARSRRSVRFLAPDQQDFRQIPRTVVKMTRIRSHRAGRRDGAGPPGPAPYRGIVAVARRFRRSPVLERLDELGQDLVDVAHDAEVGDREDRRL